MTCFHPLTRSSRGRSPSSSYHQVHLVTALLHTMCSYYSLLYPWPIPWDSACTGFYCVHQIVPPRKVRIWVTRQIRRPNLWGSPRTRCPPRTLDRFPVRTCHIHLEVLVAAQILWHRFDTRRLWQAKMCLRHTRCSWADLVCLRKAQIRSQRIHPDGLVAALFPLNNSDTILH